MFYEIMKNANVKEFRWDNTFWVDWSQIENK